MSYLGKVESEGVEVEGCQEFIVSFARQFGDAFVICDKISIECGRIILPIGQSYLLGSGQQPGNEVSVWWYKALLINLPLGFCSQSVLAVVTPYKKFNFSV